MLYGLAQVSAHHGFGHLAVISPLAAGAPALAAFTIRALRPRDAAGDAAGGVQPVIDLRLFRTRTFTAAATLMFVAGLSMTGRCCCSRLLPAGPRGQRADRRDCCWPPRASAPLLPRTIAGRLTDRIGPRPVILAGMALAALGTVPFALAGAHTSEVLLGAALVVRGAGLDRGHHRRDGHRLHRAGPGPGAGAPAARPGSCSRSAARSAPRYSP